jgi:hypothetical protein
MPNDAPAFVHVLPVAVPHGALPDLGKELTGQIDGKVIIDACNPFPRRDGEFATWALPTKIPEGSACPSPGTTRTKRPGTRWSNRATSSCAANPLQLLNNRR